MAQEKQLPIGVFDSGMGGISVLADLITLMPQEDYLYFGDSGNAPYGVKPTGEIKHRSLEIAHQFLEKGIKALVVACNTATSAAIEDLRRELDIPVIGMEPALKPALALPGQGPIVVMATPVTLREKKFNQLMERLVPHRQVIQLPCPGLVEIIEREGAQGDALKEYLRERFEDAAVDRAGVIVLGCTHYVFIKKTIHEVLQKPIPLIDGNLGTAKQVERLLAERNQLRTTEGKETKVHLMNSGKSEGLLSLSETLLRHRLKELQFNGGLNLTLSTDF